MHTFFITRALSPESPFRAKIEAAGHIALGQSLVTFSPTNGWKLEDLLPFDWIFFYSARGATYFAEGLSTPLPTAVRLAAIGKGTAQSVETALGHWPAFVGNGAPEASALAFGRLCEGQRVLFPRARHSEESVGKWLGDKITRIDLVVYENAPLTEFPRPEAEALVFTSPLNASAYYAQYPPGNEKVLAIGQTTASRLAALGLKKVFVADDPSEDGLAELCLGCFAQP